MNTKKELPRLISSYALRAGVVVFGVAVVALVFFVLPTLTSVSFVDAGISATSTLASPALTTPRAVHLATPSPMKAIYMSQCVVGTPNFRDELVALIDETELNAMVIDIRDYTGKIAFPTKHPLLKDMVSDECGARDMKSFIERLHQKDIYVIGRITTFQNPAYTKLHPEEAVQSKSGGVWKDRKGLAFVDVGSRPYWESVVVLGKEAHAVGFDELNFDYIRFPSDGNMADTDFTHSVGKSKAQALEEFYQYLTDALRSPSAPGAEVPVLSADLFGYVTVHEDDLGIGQILERALPYFDYIYPMTYPSHYTNGFAGIKNVNNDVYGVIYNSLVPAEARAHATTTRLASFTYSPVASTSPQLYSKPQYFGKIVPWLQDFDYPVEYTPAMVAAQIKAAQDAGIDSYLFWDAGNKYSSLRQVLADFEEAN